MKTQKCSIIAIVALFALLISCGPMADTRSSDERQRAQQETMLKEATAQTGMPAIKNFRERKLLKDILELRDQTGLVTYTYTFSDFNACFVYVGETVGYPLPYSTQYTNPMRLAKGYETQMSGNVTIPQADPNGLFSPSAAEGTWTLMKNPAGKETGPSYMEQRINAFSYKLPDRLVCKPK